MWYTSWSAIPAISRNAVRPRVPGSVRVRRCPGNCSTTAARVSTYAYVNPIVAVLLGALFAGEAITPRVAVAALVIVGSVALIIASRARPVRRRTGSSETSPAAVAAGAGGAS